MVKKQYLAIEIFKIVRLIVKLSVFRYILATIVSLSSEKLNYRGQHTNCVSYYDEVINRDVT